MITPLPSAPLDLLGDIHGELSALEALLAAAGYDPDGNHPDGRHLVFLGDLVDRGPDSPGVVRLVRRLIGAGKASAILGNHELNLLRAERKAGNDWFWGERTAHDARYLPWNWAEPAGDAETLEFFASLPLALVRDDIRVVHAAWHADSMATLARQPAEAALGSLFDRLDAEADAALVDSGAVDAAMHEKAAWRHHFADPSIAMPMLPAVGRLNAQRQMLNPVRVASSGVERCGAQPFYAAGQWRFSERVRWWDDYTDDVPVVVGHYWREYMPKQRLTPPKGDEDLFDGVGPLEWLGPRKNVFCVDYSVGARWYERKTSAEPQRTRLAMLRWPERMLVLDTGETAGTTGFGRG